MRRTIQRTLVIVLGGAVLGLAANAVSPRRIPYITPPRVQPQARDIVSLKAAHELWNSGAVFFLDARNLTDYVAGHIANAFNLPVEEFDQYYPGVAAMLSPDSVVIVYCDGEQCELSHQLALKFRQLGYRNVRVLVNGWTAWRAAGLPTHSGDKP